MSPTVSAKEALEKFHITPKDIIYRMRESWMEGIENGHHPIIEQVLPYFELEAIARLKREINISDNEAPTIKDGFEKLRLFWLNEALHNYDGISPISKSEDHLSSIGLHSVNIIVIASELRDAIHYGKSEKAAALGMTLISEIMLGGFFKEFIKIKSSKENSYENGIGRESADYNKLRPACINLAKRLWSENPELRIGEISKNILEKIKENKHQLPLLEALPKENTIKSWLRAASKSGRLVMPEGAQRHGRQAKHPA